MSMHYISMDRSQKFETNVTPDRRNPDLRVLLVKGFDSVNLTVTQDQLKQIGATIEAETGGAPF